LPVSDPAGANLQAGDREKDSQKTAFEQRFFPGKRISYMMRLHTRRHCSRRNVWFRPEVDEMRHMRTPGCVFRKVFWLAALGFGVLFLSGPVIGIVCVILAVVLSIASTLFPFVIIGLVVWLPFRALYKGKQPTWSDIHQNANMVWKASFVMPVSTAADVCRGAITRFQGAGERIKSGAQSLGAFFVEVVSGAAVGVLFAFIASSLEQPRKEHLLYAASAGAVMGIGVGLSRFRAWQAAEPAVDR
jgi:hypothetical protein